MAAVVVLVLSAFGWVHASVATLAWDVGRWICSLSTGCNLRAASKRSGDGDAVVFDCSLNDAWGHRTLSE